MQLSNLFTALLAGLAIATPTPFLDPVNELSVRAAASEASAEIAAVSEKVKRVPTATYDFVAQLNPNLEVGGWYVFTAKWPTEDGSIPAGTQSAAEFDQLLKDLGFKHIAVIVGQVVTLADGSLDFGAKMYHLLKTAAGPTVPIIIKTNDWVPNRGHTHEFQFATEQAKAAAIPGLSTLYETQNPNYSIQDNNCNTYVQHVLTALR